MSQISVPAALYGGVHSLEVVGEASYQDSLWRVCGRSQGEKVRHDVIAVLVPEPTNPYDSNAISVQIDGDLVGYLPKEIAGTYLPGLKALMRPKGAYVALNGVIVGGGIYSDGPGRLGVWLQHDPADFGVVVSDSDLRQKRSNAQKTVMRTGYSEALLTDADDASYDLSWAESVLASDDEAAITMLRELLATERDVLDRHYQYAELENRLYRRRDVQETALAEFDTVCRRHDAEMNAICEAFLVKWGKVPVLETYRQMAIRLQKQHDWTACAWWAERGLSLYGDAAARADAVEDLTKRRNRALTKLQAQAKPPTKGGPTRKASTSVAQPAGGSNLSNLGQDDQAANLETLECTSCATAFQRVRLRGRKPLLCPECRAL